MPTVVTKVVRYTGGDYTTIQAALDATPANLVTADEQWDILIDESASGNLEWTISTQITVPARTTDATRYIRIRPNTGKSFADHANKLTSALRYSAARGVGITSSTAFVNLLIAGAQYTRIEGLQFYAPNNVYFGTIDGANGFYRDCIFEAASNHGDATVCMALGGDGTRAINCLVIAGSGFGSYLSTIPGPNGGVTYGLHNCTFINGLSSGTPDALRLAFNTVLLKNCGFFGHSAWLWNGNGTIDAASNYNATDRSSGPTNWGANSLTSLTSASQFQSVTAGSVDARSVTSGSLDGAGTRDQTYTLDLDIVGQSRPTSGPSIGAWEASPVVPVPNPPTGVTAGSITTTGFTAVWTDASGDETGFKVQTAPSPYSSWTTASGSPTAANATSLAVTGLSPGTTYKARVASTNANGDSAWVESPPFVAVASVKVRPVSTVTAGPWTAVGAATQHEAIDEMSANDSDYITTSSAGTSEHALGAVTDPQVSYGHTVRYRFRSATNDTYQVRLVQGTTVISTDPTPRTPGGTFTTYEWTLTPTEADSITDYSALRIRHTVV